MVLSAVLSLTSELLEFVLSATAVVLPDSDFPPEAMAPMIISATIAINQGLVKNGFLFFAPQLGHTFADLAISLPQVLHVVILLLLISPPKLNKN